LPMDTQRKAAPHAGVDVVRRVRVTLQEAYSGTTRLFVQELASGRELPLELHIPPGVAAGTRVATPGMVSGDAPGAHRVICTC
jgi:hypothetical protein